MRSIFPFAAATRAGLLVAVMLGIAACGNTDPELEVGEDYSSSALQRKVDLLLCLSDGDLDDDGVIENPNPFFEVNPIGQLIFAWEPVDGATHYRFFEAPAGDSDGDGAADYVQVGGDIPAANMRTYDCEGETVEWFEQVQEIAPHLLDWDSALYRVDACDAGGCEELGVQDIVSLSLQYITPLTGGNAFDYSANGERLVLGAGSEPIFIPCEAAELEAVEEPDPDIPCQYNSLLDVPDDEGNPFDPTTLGLIKETYLAAGAVQTYSITDGIATFDGTLRSPNLSNCEGFGALVAVSDDGNRLAVSAIAEQGAVVVTGIDCEFADDVQPYAGAVYIFERVPDGDAFIWEQRALLTADNAEGDPDVDDCDVVADPSLENCLLEGDLFGSALAFSADGATLAVAAWGEDSMAMGINGDGSDNSASGSGAVYVFREVAGVWGQEAYIKAANTDADDTFGAALAMSADGSRLAVGAVRESSAAAGTAGNAFDCCSEESGAVYVFDYDGSSWSQQAYLKAAQPSAKDEFGTSLAFDDSGTVLAVGAPQEDSIGTGLDGVEGDDSRQNTGAVYVFERNGAAAWTQTAFLKATNADPVDEFGFSVALSGDGSYLLGTSVREGSRSNGVNGSQELDDFVSSGAGYLFTKQGGDWQVKSYLKSPNNSPGQLFGWDAAFALDGMRLAVLSFSNSTVYLF